MSGWLWFLEQAQRGLQTKSAGTAKVSFRYMLHMLSTCLLTLTYRQRATLFSQAAVLVCVLVSGAGSLAQWRQGFDQRVTSHHLL